MASERCWGSKSASRAQTVSGRGGAWSSAAFFKALMDGSDGAHSEAGRTGMAYQAGFRELDAGIEPTSLKIGLALHESGLVWCLWK